MNHDAIDRALGDEREITPSPDFARRVMRSVHDEAAHRQAMRFPWQPLAAALAVTAGLILAAALTGGGAPPVEASLPELPAYLATALPWLSTALAASLGLAWWSVRFAGR